MNHDSIHHSTLTRATQGAFGSDFNEIPRSPKKSDAPSPTPLRGSPSCNPPGGSGATKSFNEVITLGGESSAD